MTNLKEHLVNYLDVNTILEGKVLIQASSSQDNGISLAAARDGWLYLSKVCAALASSSGIEPSFHMHFWQDNIVITGVENELTLNHLQKLINLTNNRLWLNHIKFETDPTRKSKNHFR